MVSRKEKLRATEFICERLEDSGLYVVQNRDHQHALVSEKSDVREEPRTIDVLIPNFLGKVDNFHNARRRNRNSDVYTVAVLYKDGETAFVRMVEKNSSWRTDKSLKRYTPQQINQMVALRKIEKAVIEAYGKSPVYIQPKTERLSESLRLFNMRGVMLDYSHIDDERADFCEDRESIDYKLPEDKGFIEPAAGFSYLKHNPHRKASLKSADDDFARLLKAEHQAGLDGNEDQSSEIGERIAIKLDSMSDNERKIKTRIHGADVLGAYARN